MNTLIKMLADAEIPFQVTLNQNTPQVWYPAKGEDTVCDVICHQYSYGGDRGLLEIMGLPQPAEMTGKSLLIKK